jgi:hypothetical protein
MTNNNKQPFYFVGRYKVKFTGENVKWKTDLMTWNRSVIPPQYFTYSPHRSTKFSTLTVPFALDNNPRMTVHTFHIFDRRGKTLFTKRYVKTSDSNRVDEYDDEQLSEQRKLVFGMVFSLRELSGSLSPSGSGDLHLVKTGAATLYNYETASGLRFVLYTTADTSTGGGTAGGNSGAAGGITSPVGTLPSTGNLTTGNLAMTGASLSASAPSASNSGANTPLHGGSAHGMMTNPTVTSHVRQALQHIYEHLWVNFVVRSPMYTPHDPDIRSTNFEASLVRAVPFFKRGRFEGSCSVFVFEKNAAAPN